MRKRIAIASAILILLLAAGAYWDWLHAVEEIQKSPQNETTIIEPKSMANRPTTGKVPEEYQLSAEASAEVKRCLGAPAADMDEFQSLVNEKTKSLDASVEWKNIHFEENGKKFRLRLAREVSESGRPFLELKLFGVDSEGLPDMLPIPDEHKRDPSEAVIESYTKGKRVTEIQEARTIPLEGGGEIRVESSDGLPVELELEKKGMHVACSVKFGQASCKCF